MVQRLFTLLILVALPCFAKAEPIDLAPHQHDIAAIELRLNKIHTMTASFQQLSDDNAGLIEGHFYLSRPGKLRWQYDGDQPLIIIIKGKRLMYHDVNLNEVTYLPVQQHLASFLTRETISFSEDVDVTAVEKSDEMIAITIAMEDKSQPGTLTFFFATDTLDLHGLEIYDSVGKTHHVNFHHAIYDIELNDTLFSMQHRSTPRIKK